jgi:hypothetical protein
MVDGIEKIIRRIGGTAEDSLIEKTYRYLERSKGDSGMVEEAFISKETETEQLINFANENGLWYETPPFAIYLDEGAEQKVFYSQDRNKVIKFNDGIFYVNWSQYLESLIIHNQFFKNTRYDLIGFLKINNDLYFVVEQDYIQPTEPTQLSQVRELMLKNGFTVKRNNDYINDDLGIIIEDLHDENVIMSNGVFFFLDTVIYFKG